MHRVQAELSESDCWLLTFLSSKSPRLYQRYLALREGTLRDLLPFAQLPDFTDHGVKHAQSVQACLGRLIPPDLPQALSAFEVFALMSASLLHDIGMLLTEDEGETSERIRIDHFHRSRRFVLKNHAKLGLSEHEAKVIGEICRAHGMPNLDYLAGRVYSLHRFGEIRVPLLSALLRLADVLDVTYDRAPAIVAANRQMAPTSRRHWETHRAISDVQIRTAPSWDIIIVAMPGAKIPDLPFYDLRNFVQRELDTTSSLLRAVGIFFKKIELVITRADTGTSQSKRRNPFLMLDHFTSKNARMFAGRDREIQEMIERVVGRRLVVLIGESGVGKTSLIEAGVLPQLRAYKFGIVPFSFQNDPIQSLISALNVPESDASAADDILACVRQYLNTHRGPRRLLLVGDHLEQMFTIEKTRGVRRRFVQEASRILGSDEPVTFLFSIREDYLPDLYNLSLDIPEVYSRENTFRLHRLSRENAIAALRRASAHAVFGLPDDLIEQVAEDLCYEGGGMVYPPFLQIVGGRIYSAARYRSGDGSRPPSELLYAELGGIKRIVNHYLESLLDQYVLQEKGMVGRILGLMVTEHRTKKRVRMDEIRNTVPECSNVDRLLKKLVDQRIIRRSLGDYELIHDFLAQKVIDLINKKRFLSPPVRTALELIEANCTTASLSCAKIATRVGVTQAHLGTLFREQLGVTVNEQLGSTRIATAKTFLGEDREKMSQIAARAGFRSLSSFSRKFREVEGITAQEYRKGLIAVASRA